MPLVDHNGLSWPTDDTVLWRYMDLARFVTILQDSMLYFPSVGTLAQLDPYEGRYPHRQAAAMSNPKAWKIADEGVASGFTEEERAKIVGQMASMFIPQHEANVLTFTFVNCWHANPSESDAMWRLYSLQGQGLALRTTFERLKHSVQGESKRLVGGLVTYADYEKHASIEMQEEIHVVFSKRDSFAHEREFRLAYQVPWAEREAFPAAAGLHLSFDLAVAVDEVYVSPAAPQWLLRVVQGLLGRYGLPKLKAMQSPLYQPRKSISTP